MVTAFTNFKKWQDKKWIPEGALGLDPADVEPRYVQGKTAYTITGRGPRPRPSRPPRRRRRTSASSQLPTDQTPGAALRLRRGLHDQRQVGQHGQGGGADRLPGPARHPEGARSITALHGRPGAEPDKAEPAAVVPVDPGSRQGNPFYTIQDQAFPKQQADQYFAVQSDVLQGKVDSGRRRRSRCRRSSPAWAKKLSRR